MDADFINVYTEVLLENAEAVIRQNFMLQARLKVMEKTLEEKEKTKQQFEQSILNNDTEKEGLRNTVDRLNNQIAELQNKVDSFKRDNDSLNSQIADWQNRANSFESDATIEKQRIQQAYNDSQKTISSLTTEKDSLNKQITELLSQIESLKPSQVITEESKVTKRKPKSEVVIDETGGSSKINTTTSTRTEFGGTF
jgi:chromosome segregation ATPase